MNLAPPAGQHTVRRHNIGLVIGAIAAAAPISRAAVAARTGLTKATVSSLVETVITAGLVTETGQEQRSGRGRRGTELSLAPDGVHGLGIEIGVDYLASCVVDLAGRVRGTTVLAWDNRARRPGYVLGRLARLVRTALTDAAGAGIPVAGIGLAVPGLVEPAAGLLRTAPNLGWRDLDLDREVRARTELGERPLLLGNEANFAALAELWSGGPADFVYVSGEIGIGAGIVVGGALFDGVRGFGGEVGHVPVDPDGPRCSCGASGCLERMAGLDTILELAGAESAEVLLDRLAAAEPTALAAVAEAGRWLGIGLAGVLNVVDVPTVVLGGRYAQLHPWLAGPVAAELERRMLGGDWRPARVLGSVLDPYAAVRGAATAVVRSVLGDPVPFLDGVGQRPVAVSPR
jgi:predicted NBD/HSP70 family sugar kinase